MSKRSSRRIGRPPLSMPEPIPDTPENVARAILNTPPKPESEWRYLRESRSLYKPSAPSLTRSERRRAEREGRNGAHVTDFVSPTCPSGHPEQFLAWMRDGVEPVACSRCGHTPVIET